MTALSDLLPEGGFVIADLEYTSWEGALARSWSGPGEYMEIVQIGAVRVRGDDCRETDTFMALVRPTLNPVLSDYFIDLTGITNEDVAENGIKLSDAVDAFAAFVGETPILSHGPDGIRLGEDCARHGIDNRFAGHDWRDIGPVIREITGETLMSSDLPARFGLEMPGRAHDAVDDTRALARVLAHLGKMGAV